MRRVTVRRATQRRGRAHVIDVARRVVSSPSAHAISIFSVMSTPRIFLPNRVVALTVHPARPQRSGGS
jgi:hypothetical protein